MVCLTVLGLVIFHAVGHHTFVACLGVGDVHAENAIASKLGLVPQIMALPKVENNDVQLVISTDSRATVINVCFLVFSGARLVRF